MRVTVTAKGPTLDALIRETTRDLRAANRRAGRDAAKAGTRAMNQGAPRIAGRRLRTAADVDAWPDRVAVEFHPSKGVAGYWAIADTGRRGGYLIRPRRARVLTVAAGFAMTARPGAAAGSGAWVKAGQRLAAALDRELADVYDDALGV